MQQKAAKVLAACFSSCMPDCVNIKCMAAGTANISLQALQAIFIVLNASQVL